MHETWANYLSYTLTHTPTHIHTNTQTRDWRGHASEMSRRSDDAFLTSFISLKLACICHGWGISGIGDNLGQLGTFGDHDYYPDEEDIRRL